MCSLSSGNYSATKMNIVQSFKLKGSVNVKWFKVVDKKIPRNMTEPILFSRIHFQKILQIQVLIFQMNLQLTNSSSLFHTML